MFGVVVFLCLYVHKGCIYLML